MKPFSFVHTADLHLGYEQYNLDTRREDFYRAFQEVVDRTLELKPDLMIIAGDLFQHARPSNSTLEDAITGFRRLKDAGITVLAVDGSHDAAPNTITGTILNPLDRAGLIYYLPRHEAACWRNGNCYVYGVPNLRTRRRTKEQLPSFYEVKKPNPSPDYFNIFVFHMALDMPSIMKRRRGMEAEVTSDLLPEGFNYYAGGHIHSPVQVSFKGGVLVYSGCTETVSYEDADVEKGFYHVEVDEEGIPHIQRIKLETPRRFIVLDDDYTSLRPDRITELAVQSVRRYDEPGVVIVPILRGVLPVESSRREVDLARIRNAAEKALLVRPILQMRETAIPDEVIRSIFEGKLEDLRAKAFQFFFQFFCQRYPKDEADRYARLALDLIPSLTQDEEDKTRKILEDALGED
ncbi:MAG: exonuclease SbcCD subunit D [Candidatus Bathyarchaeia archaeon]